MITALAVVVAAVLCSLVAGFVFAFAVVVMPGFAKLPDREFIRAFQEVDGVIQRGQPLFGLVWIGSALVLAVAVVLGIGRLEGLERLLLIAAGVLYFLGVQLPTLLVNVPLNGDLQAVDLEATDEDAWRSARQRFERRWNRWNVTRTVLSMLTMVALMVVLLGL